MEKEGDVVIWEEESHALLNDWRLVRKYHPDMMFIPNLNLRNHLLLLLFTALHVARTPVFAFLHHEPKVKRGAKAWFYKLLLSAPEHLFF